ncbi:5-oxoprolinase [Rhodococcus sp. 15-725-2-2b]|nr:MULTISPECIES: hydantoinase/oxoprolinase family protein [unclassified Rhodococcus (in: high G+C Gram-positive bacteria)]OZC63690.1 5-oxoprolinase [Rhodococcus sp. 06-469-3-2]OZD40987.1 5-oxoprolinase [Rhodococcus sp. 06-1477-1A]OZE67233.1 5-oxoprolinase [Rhodococcus sp. 15-725-2-2b]
MIGVDVGGTFTDVVAVEGDEITTVKVATAAQTEQGVLQGAREAGAASASVFNHASTHGLNAIITRKLPKVAFLTTEGHIDILDAGRGWRPASGLTDPSWRRPFGDAARPLVPRYLRRGVRERLLADGSTLIELDEAQVREQLRVLARCNVEGVAVCLINAYVNSAHENRVRKLVHDELGDIPCSISSEVSPLAKEYARASTTTVDVFMQLIYGAYTERLDKGLRDLGFGGDLNFADCAAQLVASNAAMRHPYRIVFAGPAAGTVASAHFGSLTGDSELLCADVGGTSCDISLVTAGAPRVDTTFELEHDLVVNTLSNEISSIGAGGGSLVTVTPSGDLQVGPGSAGSVPGPACYGAGGTIPATTDTCLLMGILDPDGFAGGRMQLDPRKSLEAFENLPTPLNLDQRISYAFNIGVNNIAEGITNVAISHGVDPRDFSLVAFGAAGPMLLPAALEVVRAKDVIVPPHPGLFSALGLVSSDLVYADSRSAYTVLTPEAADEVRRVYLELERDLLAQLGSANDRAYEIKRSLDARLIGQSWETPFIDVPGGEIHEGSIATIVTRFHDTYQERTGNRFEALPVEGVTFRVQVVVPSEKVSYPQLPDRVGPTPPPVRTITISHLSPGETVDAGEYQRESLLAGDTFTGPAVIRERLSTTFVLPGQTVTVGKHAEIRITPSH